MYSLLKRPLLNERSERSDACSSASHKDGDRRISWGMEAFARGPNSRMNHRSWCQLGQERGGGAHVTFPAARKMRGIQHGNRQRNAMRIVQRRRGDGVLRVTLQLRHSPKRTILTCRILMVGSISMKSATESGRSGNCSRKARTLIRLSETSAL